MFSKYNTSEYNFKVEVAVILAGVLALLFTFVEYLLGKGLEHYFSIDLQNNALTQQMGKRISQSMTHRYERLFDRDKYALRVSRI